MTNASPANMAALAKSGVRWNADIPAMPAQITVLTKAVTPAMMRLDIGRTVWDLLATLASG